MMFLMMLYFVVNVLAGRCVKGLGAYHSESESTNKVAWSASLYCVQQIRDGKVRDIKADGVLKKFVKGAM